MTFGQGLAQLGWTVGRNVRIDVRWTAGKADDTRKYATELVALAPDVILAFGGSAVSPLLQLTRTVPIVFTQVTDPVGAGFVDSLARRAATPPASSCSNTASAPRRSKTRRLTFGRIIESGSRRDDVLTWRHAAPDVSQRITFVFGGAGKFSGAGALSEGRSYCICGAFDFTSAPGLK
jgi:hypothetical protein